MNSINVVAASLDDGLQVFITRRMKKTLVEDLGYLGAEVDDMEPSVAAVVIERSLARPSNGMPASWRRSTKPSSKSSGNKKNQITSKVKVATRKLMRGTVSILRVASTKTLSLAMFLVLVPFCVNVITSDGGLTKENIDRAAQNTQQALRDGTREVKRGAQKGSQFVKTKMAEPVRTSTTRRAGLLGGRFGSSGSSGGGSSRGQDGEGREVSDAPVPLASSSRSYSNGKKAGGLDLASYESVMDHTGPMESVSVRLGIWRNSLFRRPSQDN
jgi:hypothetical protein